MLGGKAGGRKSWSLSRTVVLMWRLLPVVSFPLDIADPHFQSLHEGDVNLGAVVSVHTSDKGRCNPVTTMGLTSIEFLEAILFAVKQVNDEGVIPNVTLGVYVLDDCFNASLSLMRAIQFMPLPPAAAGRAHTVVKRGVPPLKNPSFQSEEDISAQVFSKRRSYHERRPRNHAPSYFPTQRVEQNNYLKQKTAFKPLLWTETVNENVLRKDLDLISHYTTHRTRLHHTLPLTYHHMLKTIISKDLFQYFKETFVIDKSKRNKQKSHKKKHNIQLPLQHAANFVKRVKRFTDVKRARFIVNTKSDISSNLSLSSHSLADRNTKSTKEPKSKRNSTLSSSSSKNISRKPVVKNGRAGGNGKGETAQDGSQIPRFFDVVGVIGAFTSKHTIEVAKVMQLFQLPLISPSATSDALSDKSRFPYFLRTLPPDRDQVKAMGQLVRHFNWTYVSLVYSEDPYGQGSQGPLLETLATLNVCIAQTLPLTLGMTPQKYDEVIQALRRTGQPRVVLMYTDVQHVLPLLRAAERNREGNGRGRTGAGELVWVGSDSAFTVLQHHRHLCERHLGSMAVKARAHTPEAFRAHLLEKIRERRQGVHSNTSSASSSNSSTPSSSAGCLVGGLDHWVVPQELAGSPTTATSGETERDGPLPDLALGAFVIDAVYAYAYAIRNLLLDRCPGAQGLEARTCAGRYNLLSYLRQVSFNGTGGRVFEFDASGDSVGSMEVRQCQARRQRRGARGPGAVVGENVAIGTWEHRNTSIVVYNVSFPPPLSQSSSFPHWNQTGSRGRAGRPLFRDASVGTATTSDDAEFDDDKVDDDVDEEEVDGKDEDSGYFGEETPRYVPRSDCGDPCPRGSVSTYLRQTCCWSCMPCKDNEVTVNDSQCQPCPPLTWPREDRRSCRRLPFPELPTHAAAALALQVLAVVGLMMTLVTAFTFTLYRAQRVIRSSSRELSGVMLGGLTCSYLLVFPLLAPPTPASCFVTHLGFGLTFTLVYAPLLVKTHRIFRIFRAGRQSAALPSCTSSISQLFITAALISIQVVIVTVSTAVQPPEVVAVQPVQTEKMVERLCRLPEVGLATSLAYHVLLVLVCTVMAFKTRRLPDNYNESRYIAFCVDTTLLVWLIFVPAYFTATLGAHKVMVLALIHLINSYVQLACLFLPRLHALYRQIKKPPGGAQGENASVNLMSSYGLLAFKNNANNFSSGRVSSCGNEEDRPRRRDLQNGEGGAGGAGGGTGEREGRGHNHQHTTSLCEVMGSNTSSNGDSSSVVVWEGSSREEGDGEEVEENGRCIAAV